MKKSCVEEFDYTNALMCNVLILKRTLALITQQLRRQKTNKTVEK